MDDQKDRYGEKIYELEKAREDQWARERDKRLLEKLRARQHPMLHCPRCEVQLVAQVGGELSVMICPNGHGGWVEGAALERLIDSGK
jgi:hypothetical protein